jgi:DNA invertase Pin-like site-specific DNA recombinase
MKPAILYGAKSTADKNASIPTQLKEGHELAEGDGCEVVGEFKDEGLSAYTQNRGPDLVRAKAAAERLAKEHGECILVIQHSDRLARGDGIQAAHLVEYALWAIKSGVKIRSIQDPGTFADLLYAVVTGQRNHEDSKRKSLSIKAGLKRHRAKGLHGGGPSPYGYVYDRESKLLVPVDAEVPIVRRIFADFVGGASLSAIARALEADGVTTRRGKHWRSSTISQIVGNPSYIGKLRYHDEIVEGAHDGIVDVGVWEPAQTLLATRRRKGVGRPPKANHLLRGGLLQGPCGGTMICRTEPGWEVYICEHRNGLGVRCDCPNLQRKIVDRSIYSYFEQVGLDVEATRQQLADARSHKLIEVRAIASQAEAEKRRAEERLGRVRRDYSDGKLSAEDWAEFKAELTTELEGATAEVARLIEQEAEVETWGEFQDAEQDTLQKLADLRTAIADQVNDAEGVDAVRAALTRIFERFVLRPVQPGHRVKADLAWIGDLVLEPVVREQAVEGYDGVRPIFRREPLYDSGRIKDSLMRAG